MSTTRINPSSGNTSNKKNSFATHAAAAAAAAGIGVAGAMAMEPEKEDIPTVDKDVEEVKEDTEAAPASAAAHNQGNHAAPAAAGSTAAAPHTTATDEAADETIDELQPVTGSEEESDGNIDDGNLEEIEHEIDEELMPGDDTVYTDDTVFTEDTAFTEDVTATNDVAEAILAADEVDPADFDMAEVISFDEIGTVYTVDGEGYTGASFHDAAGNQLMMVDVDGDEVFDILTDMDGNSLLDENGDMLAAGDLTVGDAELGIYSDPTYLAAGDADNIDDFGADTIAGDMIS